MTPKPAPETLDVTGVKSIVTIAQLVLKDPAVPWYHKAPFYAFAILGVLAIVVPAAFLMGGWPTQALAAFIALLVLLGFDLGGIFWTLTWFNARNRAEESQSDVPAKAAVVVTGNDNQISANHIDQHGQTIEKQTNVGGNQTNVTASGGGQAIGTLKVGAGAVVAIGPNARVDMVGTPSQQALIDKLQKLIEELKTATEARAIDEERAVDVQANLQKALLQAKKPQPEGATIAKHLDTARGMIEKAGMTTKALVGLGKGIQEAVEMVRGWLQ